MRSLRIPEYGVEHNVALSSEQVAALSGHPKLVQLTPSMNGSGFDVATSSWVGVIQTRDLAVQVVPKISIPELMFLLSYSVGRDIWRGDAFEYAASDSFLDAIAEAFLRITAQMLRRGVLHGYRVRDECALVIRGRIRFEDQIRHHYGRVPPVEIRYDDYTEDIEENRLLKAAAFSLTRLRLRSNRTRSQLTSIAASLQNVSLTEYAINAVPPIGYNRLNSEYKPALELARLILRLVSIRNDRGETASLAFGVDMNKVFEDFLVSALRDVLQASEFTLPQGATGKSLYLDAARTIKLEPDISLWHKNTCWYVADAKYKKLSPAGYVNADIYQMLAYLSATGLSNGTLVYAAGEAEQQTHSLPFGKTVEVLTLDLTGSADDILARVEVIGDKIRAARVRGVA